MYEGSIAAANAPRPSGYDTPDSSPQTSESALSLIENCHKLATQIDTNVSLIADRTGGPVPCQASENAKTPEPSTLIYSLRGLRRHLSAIAEDTMRVRNTLGL